MGDWQKQPTKRHEILLPVLLKANWCKVVMWHDLLPVRKRRRKRQKSLNYTPTFCEEMLCSFRHQHTGALPQTWLRLYSWCIDCLGGIDTVCPGSPVAKFAQIKKKLSLFALTLRWLIQPSGSSDRAQLKASYPVTSGLQAIGENEGWIQFF